MSKKKLLFVNESLTLAGGEKSLIALLTKIDPDKYEIDLQLLKYGGRLDEFIPKYVNILPPIPYTQFAEQSWRKNLLSLKRLSNFSLLYAKLKYSLSLRKGTFNHPEKAQLYWESVENVVKKNSKKYDVAIAYAQGIPTFYVADKLEAKQKIAWVNARPNFPKQNKIFQRKFYETYNKIVPVSEITKEQIRDMFPDLESKLYLLVDIVDYKSILKMANLKSVSFDPNTFNILTVARLNYKSKRYDIALSACKILIEKGVNFHWYALGEGNYQQEMEKYIQENQLANHFTLLGTNVNPYPYFKAADLYVQTSEFESYGISIAEARLLNVPVVTTRYDSVYVQMIHEKNGLVVDINANAVADGIERMINDKVLYESVKSYLKSEEKENKESIQRFYKLIDN
jgi:glycosyltransferase involved in cell wall biosynthesis